MQIELHSIELREILHFLGWRGTTVEPELIGQLDELVRRVIESVAPRAAIRRFAIENDGCLHGTNFAPLGSDIRRMLAPCHEAYLVAATLGAESERLLLKEQARSAGQALLLDAVLSAAIEAVCDGIESNTRKELAAQGLFLTDRFSPGYGDMPVAQTKEICEVLSAQRSIGLAVSASGVMIPRKSVTAIMGVSREPVARRRAGCAGCSARDKCAFARNEHA